MSKYIGYWLIGLSTGTASLISVTQYLKSYKIGLDYIKYKNSSDIFPTSQTEWDSNYNTYKSSLPTTSSPLSFKDFQEHTRLQWIYENQKETDFLHLIFPFANPRLEKFNSIYYIPITENTAKNIGYLIGFGALLPIFTKTNFTSNLICTIASGLLAVKYIENSNIYWNYRVQDNESIQSYKIYKLICQKYSMYSLGVLWAQIFCTTLFCLKFPAEIGPRHFFMFMGMNITYLIGIAAQLKDSNSTQTINDEFLTKFLKEKGTQEELPKEFKPPLQLAFWSLCYWLSSFGNHTLINTTLKNSIKLPILLAGIDGAVQNLDTNQKRSDFVSSTINLGIFAYLISKYSWSMAVMIFKCFK
ncbi:hypothetical protein SteCoe_5088 [Stentor coeruleus]|uniref:Uncharacterized protein n=1 Tax=Stentor coeruleus TaxID=5963 RepID=A0A1R2CT86_9CILI|nr:hypothetical protein SteCoe_5088 [Stentor coeruleus]